MSNYEKKGVGICFAWTAGAYEKLLTAKTRRKRAYSKMQCTKLPLAFSVD